MCGILEGRNLFGHTGTHNMAKIRARTIKWMGVHSHMSLTYNRISRNTISVVEPPEKDKPSLVQAATFSEIGNDNKNEQHI